MAVVQKTGQILFRYPVDPFQLASHLGMVGGGCMRTGIQEVKHLLAEPGYRLRMLVLVCVKMISEAMKVKNMCDEKSAVRRCMYGIKWIILVS